MCFSDLPYVSPDEQVDYSARPVYVEPYRRRRSSNPQLALVRYRRGSRRSPVPWERGDLRYQWDGQAWILHRWSVRHSRLLQTPILEVIEGSVPRWASCLGGGGGSGESPGQCQTQSWRDALRLSHIFPRILNGLEQVIKLRFHRICFWLWSSRPVGIFHHGNVYFAPFPIHFFVAYHFSCIGRFLLFRTHEVGKTFIWQHFGFVKKPGPSALSTTQHFLASVFSAVPSSSGQPYNLQRHFRTNSELTRGIGNPLRLTKLRNGAPRETSVPHVRGGWGGGRRRPLSITRMG